MGSIKTSPGRGRPRNRGTGSGDTRGDLIVAAVELFLDRGVDRTTMSAIAERAGINQSSAYYWFSSKEVILATLAEDNRASLKVAQDAVDGPGSASERLYRVVYADIEQMANSALPYYELERAAAANPESFLGFSDDYAELQRLMAIIVAQGVAAGEFPPLPPEHGARAVLALNEGLQHRYDRASGTTGSVAHLGADLAVRMLSADAQAGARARLAYEREG